MCSEIPAYLILAGIENSENKVIMQSGLSENEIGPGVLESSVQQARLLQHYQKHKSYQAGYVSTVSLLFGILAKQCLLDTRLKHSRSNLVF